MRIDLSLLFTWREIAKMKNSASTNLFLILDEIFEFTRWIWYRVFHKDYQVCCK